MKIEHLTVASPYASESRVTLTVDYSKEFVSVLDAAMYVRGLLAFPMQASASVFLDNGRYLLVTRDSFTCIFHQVFPDRGCPTK